MKEPKWEFYFSAELDKEPDGSDSPLSEFYHDFTLTTRVDPDSGIQVPIEFFVNVLRMLTYSDNTIKAYINLDEL